MKIFIKFILIIFFILNVNYFANADEQLTKRNYKQTIAIDLDGVLNDYKKYDENNIPKIKNGTKEFIKTLYDKGYQLILFTNRKPLLASKWLIENDLDKYFTDVTNIKPKANIYIDDRAVEFNGDFDKTLKDINNFSVYWK